MATSEIDNEQPTTTAPAAGAAMVSTAAEDDNPDLVDAIIAYITSEFPEFAGRTAQMQEDLRKEFAGIEIYIPRRSVVQRQKIVTEVLSLFNGRNATEVARRLGIGRTTVYRILKQEGGKK